MRRASVPPPPLSGAARGAAVTVADLSEAAGAAVVEAIRSDGGRAQFVRTDISDPTSVQAMVAAAVEAYGGLHGAFNNAGLAGYSQRAGNPTVALADLPDDAFRFGIDVNVIGTFLCLKHEVPAMLASGGGSIVNTSSGAGILAVANAADYVAGKHAVIGLTKAAALDYATAGIRVNAVLPGITQSGMVQVAFDANPELVDWAAQAQPNKRVGQPSEIAEAALWLLSDAASFVTGSSMAVDGGYSMV